MRFRVAPVHTGALLPAVTAGSARTFSVKVAEAGAQGGPEGLSVLTVMVTVFPASAAAGV